MIEKICNTTLIESTVAPWDLLVQDDHNEIQHDFFSHLTLLALASASCDGNDIVKSTIASMRSR